MRPVGFFLLLVGLAALGYALFALAWDSGARAMDDRVLAGLSIVLAVGAAGLMARQRWGYWVCGAVGVAVVALIVLATLARTATPPPQDRGPVLLQDLPPNASQVAARLDAAWWATSIDGLRERERQNDALARDWAIQGDDRVRLIVLNDLTREARDAFLPLQIFLVVKGPKGTAVTPLFDDFYSDDRTAPVELRLDKTGGTVIARSGGACLTRDFTLDPTTGTATASATIGAC